jgi:hypothetical protein
MAATNFLFWPVIAFVVLPLWLKASGLSHCILPAYMVALVLELLIFFVWTRGVESSCAISESECLGATSFLFILYIVHGALALIGATFAALSRLQRSNFPAKGI